VPTYGTNGRYYWFFKRGTEIFALLRLPSWLRELDVRRRSILANLFWSIFAMGSIKGLRFISVILCGRILGTSGWGELATVYALVTFISFLVDQGVGLVPSVHRVGDRGLDRSFLYKILSYRLGMALITIAILAILACTAYGPSRLLLIFSLVLIPRSLATDWFFQRRELYHIGQLIGAIKTFVFLGLIVLLLPTLKNAEWVAVFEIATDTIAAGFGLLVTKRMLSKTNVFSSIKMVDLLRIGAPFLLMGIFTTVHQTIDVPLIRYFHGAKDAGQYDMGYRLGYFLFFTGATLIQIIRPKLVRYHEQGNVEEMCRLLKESARCLGPMALLFLIGTNVAAGSVSQWLFKAHSPLTIFVFNWAPVWVAIAFLNILCADTLICLKRNRDYLVGAALCAAVNVIANLLLIPSHSGYGAIFSTILSEAVFFAYCFNKLPTEFRNLILRFGTPQLFARTYHSFKLVRRLPCGQMGAFICNFNMDDHPSARPKSTNLANVHRAIGDNNLEFIT
jgi:O-antigen/teichoic acid export membrane protein